MESQLSTALVRFVLDNQHDPMVVLDEHMHVVEWNEAALHPEVDLVGVIEASATDGGDARICSFVEELRASRKSQTLLASPSGRVFRLEGTSLERLTLVRARELSERRDVDAWLGPVAASLIHDLNNVLTPIVLASGRLVRELDAKGETTTMVAREIQKGATLAVSLARDVLALARPRIPVREHVDIGEAMVDLQHLIRRMVGENVEIVLALADVDTVAYIDRRRLEHAVLNLVVNARDALRPGGRVTITTSIVERDGKPNVALAISDTGVGMTEDVRRQALDDFFTTKAASGGVGLGLAGVRRFVEESGGSVEIDSIAGDGTTVTMFLPCVRAERVPPPAATDGEGHGELVLVADQDERTRDSIKASLEAHGYAAVSTATQDGALEAAGTFSVRVAVLDTTLVRHGPATFLHRLRALAPSIKFVLLSEASAEDHDAGSRVVVLPKPFGEEELVRAVRHTLDSA
jgi:signal transduction histidine kinase/CheY-like chemotaxis protein